MHTRYLKIIQSPNQEIIQILKHNVIGTPGHGMLYQHRGVEDKINRIENPYFVNLSRADQLVGTCCFCKRQTSNKGKVFSSFYVRYFSFKDTFRRKFISEKKNTGNSKLREEISSLLSGQGFDISPSEKFFYYAYVDPRNKRSALLCREFGFESIRNYTTVLFSRLNPRADGNVVEAESEAHVKEMLTSFYENFTAFSTENLANRKYYFIKDDKGQLAAGVQVNPDQWNIHSLPGLMGNRMLWFFSHLPLLKKLLNKDFRFITLESLYFVPGSKKYVEQLFESLLVKYQVNTALYIVDTESNLHTMLKSLKLGPLNALSKEVKGNVIAKFVNFSPEETTVFKKHPAYISGIDAT